MLTPTDAFKLSIEKWEGLYQDDPADVGNYRRSDGRIVGTMRGVTPAAWAAFLNRPLVDVTPEMMKAISLTDASRVYEENYYQAPGFAKLAWGPSVDVSCDIGWCSGPVRGMRALQILSGAPVDGSIGLKTIEAHKSWLAEIGDSTAVEALAEWRRRWYRKLVEIRPSNQKFLKGWLNRANWQSTKGSWWQHWHNKPITESLTPSPSTSERAVVQSIGDKIADVLAHEAVQEVLRINPGLAITANLIKRLFS